ncbi:DUF5590 domain-containing protein [Atopobacter phocae]|uniref:cell wall elongation regulator TseB-like domain-containing protein n=1 Tax=Atopobacter phocae TaxID=136492 RepID=UPI00046E7075|nr:DUF5590 domain-containing protein [Atopobacter phocae]
MKKKIIHTSIIIVLLLMIVLVTIYQKSQAPLFKAEERAIALVKKKHQIKSVQNFYWFHSKKSYWTVEAIDKKDQVFFSVIDTKNKHEKVYLETDILNEKEAKAITMDELKLTGKEVKEARLGLIDNEPVWEVNYKKGASMGYYFLNAKSGQWIKHISNI